MQLTQQRSYRRLALRLAAALLLAISAAWGLPTTAAVPVTPNVAGDWEWNEHVLFVGPAEAIMAFFGVPESEGPVMHMICDSGGPLTIQQNGSSFTGTASQNASCTTQGGQSATTTPFPPSFSITGSIIGNSVHMVADVGDGLTCTYHGSMSISRGIATQLETTGGCDVPLPFHPNMDKSVWFDATRL